jgi:hypothetical protein
LPGFKRGPMLAHRLTGPMSIYRLTYARFRRVSRRAARSLLSLS